MVGHICGNCHQSRDFNIIFYLDDYFLLEEHQSMLVTCHLSLLTLIWFNCDRRHMRAVSLDALGRVHPSASPTCCTGREGKEGRGQPASGGHCERRWGCCWAERSSLPENRPAPEPPSQFPISEHNKTKQNGCRQTGQTFPLLNAETFQTHLRRSDEPDVNKSFTNQAILAKILFFFTFFL